MNQQKAMLKIPFNVLRASLGLSSDYVITGVIYGERQQMSDTILLKLIGPKIPINVEGYELMIIPLSDLQDNGKTDDTRDEGDDPSVRTGEAETPENQEDL